MMKKIAPIIILALYSILALGQSNVGNMDKLVISYNGDSTLLTEKYEIDLNKKKTYYITPIMNYLHVRGEKYRRKIKIKKQNWEEIESLIVKINHLKIENSNRNHADRIIYSIRALNGNEVVKDRNYYTEEIPIELRKLFEIIRK